MEKSWLSGKVEGWADSVGTLAGVSCKQPQSAYTRLQKLLQQEWAFVQRVTPGIGYAFRPVEKVLQDTFLPDLFEGLGEGAPERGVTRMPVKQARLTLPDPKLTASVNWIASCVIKGHLVAMLMGKSGVLEIRPLRLPPRAHDVYNEQQRLGPG